MKFKAKFVVLLLLCLSISGCVEHSTNDENLHSEDLLSDFVLIDNYRCYDKNTGIVYVLFGHREGYNDVRGYGFMSPYLSENGLFCKFVEGRVVEIDGRNSRSDFIDIGEGFFYKEDTGLIYKETDETGLVPYLDEHGVTFKYVDGSFTPYTIEEN